VLVTNNTAEFGRVKGLAIENGTLPGRRPRSTDDKSPKGRRPSWLFPGGSALSGLVELLVAAGTVDGTE
jgi:hypothetical protein